MAELVFGTQQSLATISCASNTFQTVCGWRPFLDSSWTPKPGVERIGGL